MNTRRAGGAPPDARDTSQISEIASVAVPATTTDDGSHGHRLRLALMGLLHADADWCAWCAIGLHDAGGVDECSQPIDLL